MYGLQLNVEISTSGENGARPNIGNVAQPFQGFVEKLSSPSLRLGFRNRIFEDILHPRGRVFDINCDIEGELQCPSTTPSFLPLRMASQLSHNSFVF
ncbi:unnamed protein product [Citrullus colocynthis]|uniref:Uncharacterized protein n=1 Tax=Citrullus colocynthis TaxID=252529 RepID=A0ABP0XWF8_9ROSI